MGTTQRLFIAALPLLFAGATLIADPGKPPAPNKQLHQSEVKKLITALGDRDFGVREKATKRLAEIGLPTLQALREAEEKTAM
jgi:hypothetical protein